MNSCSLVFRIKRFTSIFLLGFLVSPIAYSHNDLTVVDWGGDLARAHMQAWIIPWEKATGKQATLEYYGGGLAEIRDQVETTNVTWDVVDMEYSDLIQACDEGLLENIDQASLPNASSDFIEGALDSECGVGIYIWSTVLAYDTAAFAKKPPTTIADFFNTRDFPGNRGLRNDPRGTLEWALIAAGVPANEVYDKLSTDEGLDMAFDELDKIKPYVIWWSAGPEPVQLLDDGIVTMSAAWNGRLYRPIVEQDKHMAIVWDAQLWEIEFLAIPRGSRNLANARNFIKFATESQALADVSKYIPYGPARMSAEALVPDEVKPYLPTENLGDTALRFDSPWWAENIDRIRERFDHWVSPSSAEIQGRGARF